MHLVDIILGSSMLLVDVFHKNEIFSKYVIIFQKYEKYNLKEGA